jgi:DtxR family transcriptional regulator, Mn-dependent transcriptional regulator
MLTYTEENYLKAIWQLTGNSKDGAGTNELAGLLGLKPATVNDMLKKLRDKKLIRYEKYGKSTLLKNGRDTAVYIVRKHRLWETFLFDKLEFTWDEVHEVAEQLEHIQSTKLIDKLDKFLQYPAMDPHGDPIPDAKGAIAVVQHRSLLEEKAGHVCQVVAVKDNSSGFLQYANKIGIRLHQRIKLLAFLDYDGLLEIEVNGKPVTIGPKFAENISVACKLCK